MDVVWLSRLQFAMATMFHFIFVPLTLGLSIIVAVMETLYLRRKDEVYKRMTKFWGKLFVINFVLGVVTGITLEFQFGTNWSRYSAYVGDIFGSLLAIEATTSFFLESTFIAVWIFGWNRISPRLHAASIWIVAGAANLSALWILLANSWMQHPVGYVLRNGRAELADFWAVVTQSFAWMQYLHVISASWLLAAFFVMGVSAYHLLQKSHVDFFTRSFGIGAAFALVFSIFLAAQGDLHAKEVAEKQPAKLAAMESLWETTASAPMYMLIVPDESGERNALELLPIPGFLSFLAFGSTEATVQGLKSFPAEDRPPVTLTFLAFRIMVGLGFLFPVLAIWAFARRKKLLESTILLRVMLYSIPLPYLATQAGWIVTEVGRQPWIVYGLMRTSDAVSPIAASQVAVSLVALTLLYLLLGALDVFLLARFSRKGPVAA
jgi:cytochrome bd ubiquinol oxidase subunit I